MKILLLFSLDFFLLLLSIIVFYFFQSTHNRLFNSSETTKQTLSANKRVLVHSSSFSVAVFLLFKFWFARWMCIGMLNVKNHVARSQRTKSKMECRQQLAWINSNKSDLVRFFRVVVRGTANCKSMRGRLKPFTRIHTQARCWRWRRQQRIDPNSATWLVLFGKMN